MIFGGQKPNISKILDRHFEERLILQTLFVCCLRFTLKSYISEAFECWPFFDPKSRDMTSLKRNFLEKFLADFAEIFFEDAKLMLKKVP